METKVSVLRLERGIFCRDSPGYVFELGEKFVNGVGGLFYNLEALALCCEWGAGAGAVEAGFVVVDDEVGE